VLFYYFALSSLASAPFALWTFRPLAHADWALLGGIGLLMAASQVLILEAYRRAPPVRIAPFNYSVVVFSGLIGWLVWKNTPGWLSLVGVLLVAAGGVLSTVFGGRNSIGHLNWLGVWNHATQETA
jgi:drug/metabolite transporter (DMT)-like permease